MRASVVELFYRSQRRSNWEIRTVTPCVGRLVIEPSPYTWMSRRARQARLLSLATDQDLLPLLDQAAVVSVGPKGMLIDGVEYLQRWKDGAGARQAWWVQVPPRDRPLIDSRTNMRAAELLRAAMDRSFLPGG